MGTAQHSCLHLPYVRLSHMPSPVYHAADELSTSREDSSPHYILVKSTLDSADGGCVRVMLSGIKHAKVHNSDNLPMPEWTDVRKGHLSNHLQTLLNK
jgi:hypothetical protein